MQQDFFRDIGEGTIRRINWQDLTPVIFLAKIPRLALRLPILFAALFAIALTMLLHFSLAPSPAERGHEESTVMVAMTKIEDTRTQCLPNASCPLKETWKGGSLGKAGCLALRESLLQPCRDFLANGCRIGCGDGKSWATSSWSERGKVVLHFFLMLVVWTYFGGMICRAAAVQLTVRENESPRKIHRFLCRHGMSIIWAVLLPLIGIFCCYLPILLIGGLSSLPVGDWIAAVLYPLALLAGLAIAVLGVALCLGGPLLFAAVAVDGSDAFDAVSRLYSYVYQRPLHYLFYVVSAALLTLIAYVFLTLFLSIAVFAAGAFGQPAPGELPGRLVAFWVDLFQLVQLAFLIASFWVAAVAIYLLLRKSVDDAPLTELYRLPGGSTEPIPAPVIATDAQGAPEVPNGQP